MVCQREVMQTLPPSDREGGNVGSLPPSHRVPAHNHGQIKFIRRSALCQVTPAPTVKLVGIHPRDTIVAGAGYKHQGFL